jgi:hypothetical protein
MLANVGRVRVNESKKERRVRKFVLVYTVQQPINIMALNVGV